MSSFYMASAADQQQHMSSRLKQWMTPVPDNRMDLGDFKVWSCDESMESLAPTDATFLLTPPPENHGQQQQRWSEAVSRAKSYFNPYCKEIISFDGFHRSSGGINKRSSRESSCNSSTGSSISCSNDNVVETIMNMKIGTWKALPKKTCGFCYIQYKRHCQTLGLPFPHANDPGFWLGHTTKDKNGDVVCPELRKLTCPLCFATGKKAHTLKFCPLDKQTV